MEERGVYNCREGVVLNPNFYDEDKKGPFIFVGLFKMYKSGDLGS